LQNMTMLSKWEMFSSATSKAALTPAILDFKEICKIKCYLAQLNPPTFSFSKYDERSCCCPCVSLANVLLRLLRAHARRSFSSFNWFTVFCLSLHKHVKSIE
jgi:hypothetical protein